MAVLLFAILHAIRDEENAHEVVARLMDAVPSGSYLALSHMGSDFFSPETMVQMEQMARGGSSSAVRVPQRGRCQAVLRRP